MRRFLRVVVAVLLVGDIFRPVVLRHFREFGKIPAPAVMSSSGGWVEVADSAAVPYTRPASARR